MPRTAFLLQTECRGRVRQRTFHSATFLEACLERAVEAMADRNGVDVDDLPERIRFRGPTPIYGETRCGDDRVVWSRIAVPEFRAA